MKLIGTKALGAVLELNPTDCCQLADAVEYALLQDVRSDRAHLEAMGAALRACSVIAALDTATDSKVPYEGLLAHVRKVWGPVDNQAVGVVRIPTDPV